MESAHNLILVGGTGTGKTHLATALGVAARVKVVVASVMQPTAE